MPAGRPTEYDPSFCDRVEEYLAQCTDERQPNGLNGSRLKVSLPKIEGFALFLGVSVKSLYNWADQNPEFLQALGRIKAVQKERLIDCGLSGDYNQRSERRGHKSS